MMQYGLSGHTQHGIYTSTKYLQVVPGGWKGWNLGCRYGVQHLTHRVSHFLLAEHD